MQKNLQMNNLETFKLGGANVLAWFLAGVSLSDVLTIFQILAAIGGLAVSVYTVLYLRKKSKALDNGQKVD